MPLAMAAGRLTARTDADLIQASKRGDLSAFEEIYAAHAGRMKSIAFHLLDRKSTRLNSSHLGISYAVFCFKNKLLFLLLFAYVIRCLLEYRIDRRQSWL